MNLIIDIPNERYELLKAVNKQLGTNGATPEELAILNGVPLKEVADDIKAELWDSGMNMIGEYQGVWVRYSDIEKAFDKYIQKGEE